MGDYSEYIRGKIAERGPQNAKFDKDGFDRWAENTYPARTGQVDKVPTEMPSSTEAPTGGRLYKKHMSLEHKMSSGRRRTSSEDSMCGGGMMLKVKPYNGGMTDRVNKFQVVDVSGKVYGKYVTKAEAESAKNEMSGGSFLSALKKGAKVVGKYAKKAAKFVVKHKDTIKEGVKMAREYAPVVRDVYKASKTKEGRKALLDAALGAPAEEDQEDEMEGGRQMTPLEYQMALEGRRGGSFLSALKKGAKVVGKYAKKAAKFVVKHKDTIKEGVKMAREYAPVVRDVYKAAKSKEGRKALLDAALGAPKEEMDVDAEELEGGRRRSGLSRRQEAMILQSPHGGSVLSFLKKGAKSVGKFAKKAAKFVVKHKDTIKEGVKMAREYAPVVRDVYKASKTKEGRKALLDAALGAPKEEEEEDEAEGGAYYYEEHVNRGPSEEEKEYARKMLEEKKRKMARRGGRKPSARGAIVSKVMKEMGLSLPEASKYVKENGLY